MNTTTARVNTHNTKEKLNAGIEPRLPVHASGRRQALVGPKQGSRTLVSKGINLLVSNILTLGIPGVPVSAGRADPCSPGTYQFTSRS